MLERFLIAFEAASLLLLVAAVGAVILAARRTEPARPEGAPGTPGSEAEEAAIAMDLTWYLVLSALIFATGVVGVLLRR